MSPSRVRRILARSRGFGVLAAAVALAAFSVPASAGNPVVVADAGCPIQPVIGGGAVGHGVVVACNLGFPVLDGPPNAPTGEFIYSNMTISSTPGSGISFSPPRAANSTPAVDWTCSTDTPAPRVFHATCTPTPAATVGQWTCYDPFVSVDITSGGSVADTLVGRARCTSTQSQCSATPLTGGVGVAHCQQAAFPHAPVPFECTADYSAVTGQSVAWSVKCSTVDP
jgi:hypothetical protein